LLENKVSHSKKEPVLEESLNPVLKISPTSQISRTGNAITTTGGHPTDNAMQNSRKT
jgi:hypothetical protein